MANLPESLAIGSVVASDAFFPFADGLLAAAEAGATAVIQPGGSLRDGDVVAAAPGPMFAKVTVPCLWPPYMMSVKTEMAFQPFARELVLPNRLKQLGFRVNA